MGGGLLGRRPTIREGRSAGLTSEGTQPTCRTIPLASSSALIFLKTSSKRGEEDRPFHSENRVTVESTRRCTRLRCALGNDSSQCKASSTARSSSALIWSAASPRQAEEMIVDQHKLSKSAYKPPYCSCSD